MIGDMMHRLVDFVGKDGSVRVTADNAEFLLGLMSNVGDVLSTAAVRTPDAVNGLARIQRAFIEFTTTSYDKWPPVLKLVEKLSGYIQILQPDLVTITRAVKTGDREGRGHLRRLRVDRRPPRPNLPDVATRSRRGPHHRVAITKMTACPQATVTSKYTEGPR
ncbi:hypothetical protein [Gordonia malaquae]|uniref:hypothetical protein n=1 Tax=Gordonia malaquae TaxID=410332 RepID=UPI000AA346EC|nr:hypothetical protein [Gordonia malaquae]